MKKYLLFLCLFILTFLHSAKAEIIDAFFADNGTTFSSIYGQLIRNKISIGPAASSNVQFFNNKGGFIDSFNQQAICQVCHTQTRHFRNSGEINAGKDGFDHTNKVSANCITCHPHRKDLAHAGSPQGSTCGTVLECHGTHDSHPPHLDPQGLVAAECSQCHDPNNFPNFRDDKAVVCAQCHDHGSGVATTPPDWGTSPEPQCSECHEASPTSGSHTKHLTRLGFNCNDCHAETVVSLTPPSQHLDGNIDVYDTSPGDLGYPTDKRKGSPYSSCSTAYCHSSGQSLDGASSTPVYAAPAWGTVVICGDCHKTSGGGALGEIDTGSHAKHMAAIPSNLVNGCGDCHDGAASDGTSYSSENHRDGLITTAAATNYTASGEPGNGYGRCSSVPCHGAGTPEWGSSVSCEDCHLASTDIDDFVYANNTLATINSSQWSYSGHGRASGPYDLSNNPAADLPTAAGDESPCRYCHDDSVSHGNPSNPFRLANLNGLANGANDNCLICHDTAAGNGYDPDAGGAMTRKTATIKIDQDHYGKRHSEINNGGSLCWDCHDPHGDRTSAGGNIFMIHESVTTEKSDQYGTPATFATPVFINNTMAGDYARNSAPFNGICQVCHRSTAYYRHDSGANGHYSDSVCIYCHSHGTGSRSDNAFNHGDDSSNTFCINCHGHDAGTYFDPDMQSPYEAGNTASQGRGTVQSHSTHTEIALDDLRGPGIYCDSCHDIKEMPKLKNLDGSGGHTLAETDICNTCHSDGGSYDGVNDPLIGAKANWTSGVYANNALRADKEKWCATCHDETASVINSISSPNIVGDEDGQYTYGTGWGYYKTGHGLDADKPYPYKGAFMEPPLVNNVSRSINCDGCHDSSAPHIDGIARTFDDSDVATTDPSFYRKSYRLKRLSPGLGGGSDLTEPMEIPRDSSDTNTVNLAGLCYSCHNSMPFTFANSTYTNMDTSYPGIDNLHEYHMKMITSVWSSDWSGNTNSGLNCVTCHNVHGSTRLAMIRDGKLTNRQPGLQIWYNNDALVSYTEPDSTPPVPADLPLSVSTGTVWFGPSAGNLCINCHVSNQEDVRTPSEPFQSVNFAPSLSWTGESGYTTDGANPDIGATGSSFTFRTMFTDLRNKAPSSIQVWVDDNNNSIYEAGEKHNLAEVDAEESTTYNGKIYQTSLVLDNSSASNKPYRFYAISGSEAIGPATEDSIITILAASSGSGNAPILSWTAENNAFMADGVSPHSDEAFGSFEFRVQYSDDENDPPALIEVWVDTDQNGSFSIAERYGLLLDGGGADFSEGKFYSKIITMDRPGQFAYRFYATDGLSEAAGLPISAKTFRVTNNPPSLAWPVNVDYHSDGAHPDSDVEGGTDNIIFKVNYTDMDNHAPSLIQVWIDLDDSNSYEAHEKYDLTESDAEDTTYYDGKEYRLTKTVPYVDDETVNYRFYATDGSDNATGEPTSSNNNIAVVAPTSNHQAVLSWTTADCLTEGVRPPMGVAGADFQFYVNYTDADNQCAETVQLWLDENDNNRYESTEKYNLTAEDNTDINCADGKVYKINKLITAADGDSLHNYRFYASDGMQAAAGEATMNSTVTVLADAFKVGPNAGTDWFHSIADACSVSGDIISIMVYPNADFSPATYVENQGCSNKNQVSIVSTCGADFTILQKQTSSGYTLNTTLINDLLIDGFTFTGGGSNVPSLNITTPNGGTAIIKDSKVHDNTYGIRISNSKNSRIGFDNVEIYDNYIGLDVFNSPGSTIDVDNIEVHRNTSNGLYFDSPDTAININGSDIHYNSGSLGSAIYAKNSLTTVRITDTLIHDNNGSAILAINGPTLTIEDSEVYSNNTTSHGLIYFDDMTAAATIKRSVFLDNITTGNGGVFNTHTDMIIENSVFADNQAADGGVFFVDGEPILAITHSTFADNTATSEGGVLYANCPPGTTTFRNSIFWNNSSAAGNIAFKNCTDSYQDYITITDSDVTSGAENFVNGTLNNSGGGNIDPAQDPLFVNSAADDYHLLPGSPVINKANANYATSDDIDGELRPKGLWDDMGADEEE